MERDEEMYEEAQPETSESGAPIFRHQARERPFEMATGEDDLIEAIDAHIAKHIGPVSTVYHEIISDLVHIDVHICNATEERPFHVLTTSGMSALPMKAPQPELQWAELCILLPASWPLGDEAWQDETNFWPIQWLKQLARLPHEYESWLWASHTIPNGDPPEPFAPGTDLCGWILLPPISLPTEFVELKIDDEKTVRFFALWALHEDEMNLKLKKGADPLIDLLAAQDVSDVLNPRRASVCEGNKRRWFWNR